MKYNLFLTLYKEALEYSDIDMYITERGWQDWMDNYPNKDLGTLLASIYNLAHKPLKAIRQERNISRAQFSRMYSIPIRTIENWDGGKTTLNEYLKCLLCYTLFIEDLTCNE